MGYILPITQHTYVNYHQRMIESKKSPYYIGELPIVTFNTIEGDEYDPYTQRQKIEESEEKEEESQQHDQSNLLRGSRGHRYYVDSETNALLTGKGQQMNLQA